MSLQVLEQLLRMVPDVKRIYVVVRNKRGVSGASLLLPNLPLCSRKASTLQAQGLSPARQHLCLPLGTSRHLANAN